PEGVALQLPGRTVTLPRTGQAPEERYSDGNVTFSSGGIYARIEEPDGTYICRDKPSEVPWEEARARGIEVRAAGQESEWSLEIDEGHSIVFIGDAAT